MLETLHTLCQQGRLYEVEDWIRQGKPIQKPGSEPTHRPQKTALGIALETGQHSLCLLLLRNGYCPNAEAVSPFNLVLKKRRKDLVDLLFEFGADPHRVDVWRVFDSYDRELFERFWRAGVKLTRNRELGQYLADHTSNKPLFGFVKRYRTEDPQIQRQLNMALDVHTQENNEKGVLLCLWAGADPHAAESSLHYGRDDDPDEECSAAVETAAMVGNKKMLKAFKPDPERVDFDELYKLASNREVVEFLRAIRLPSKLTDILVSLSGYVNFDWFGSRDWCGAMTAVLECGVRWEPAEKEELAQMRRNLLKAGNWELSGLLKKLKNSSVCAYENFAELTRTPSMQQRMLDMGLGKPYMKPPTKKAIARQKKKEKQQEIERLASRFDRKKLYREVWERPVLEVAKDYGVSGVYLGRVCRTLQVPVPPRGYWARVRNGQTIKRPKLPTLRDV